MPFTSGYNILILFIFKPSTNDFPFFSRLYMQIKPHTRINAGF